MHERSCVLVGAGLLDRAVNQYRVAERGQTRDNLGAGFPELDIPIPWWGGRSLRFGFLPTLNPNPITGTARPEDRG